MMDRLPEFRQISDEQVGYILDFNRAWEEIPKAA